MTRSEAFKEGKAVKPAESLHLLKEVLNFEQWPLKKEQFLPGFSPRAIKELSSQEYALGRETLVSAANTWVRRDYFYNHVESRSAFDLTVIVSQQSARDAAEGLLLQMVYTQMRSEPRAILTDPPLGEVTVYRHPDPKQAVAFLRNNVAVSIENYSSGRRQPDLTGIAMAIDRSLREEPAVVSLVNDPRVPGIVRFESRSKVVRPGERADLEIEVKDDYPPLQYLFRIENGSYNRDPVEGGPAPPYATVTALASSLSDTVGSTASVGTIQVRTRSAGIRPHRTRKRDSFH